MVEKRRIIMKVFLCGPRKGTKNQWSRNFNLIGAKVRLMGYGIFNPAWFQFDTAWSDEDIESMYIYGLSFCDIIYLLDGFECDERAKKEYDYAVKNSKIVVHNTEELKNTHCYKEL